MFISIIGIRQIIDYTVAKYEKLFEKDKKISEQVKKIERLKGLLSIDGIVLVSKKVQIYISK